MRLGKRTLRDWLAASASGVPSRRRGLRRRSLEHSNTLAVASVLQPGGEAETRFRELYDQHWDDLHRYCQRRCASPADADDVLAETFTIAWRRLADIPPQDAARPWLFVVARNLLSEHYRRSDWANSVVARVSAELLTQAPAAVPGRNEPADHLEVTVQALMQLDEPDRELIQLVAWDKMTHSDAAAVLGCSTNAVAIRLSRARTRLGVKVAELLRAIDAPVAATSERETRKKMKGVSAISHVPTEEPRSKGGT